MMHATDSVARPSLLLCVCSSSGLLFTMMMMTKSTVDAHRDASGIVNHLTLVSSVKSDMPVIYEVYSQYAASSVVSSNTESFFSLVGQIQDHRKTMSSSWLETLSFIKGQTGKVSDVEIMQKYCEMFRGGRMLNLDAKDAFKDDEDDESKMNTNEDEKDDNADKYDRTSDNEDESDF